MRRSRFARLVAVLGAVTLLGGGPVAAAAGAAEAPSGGGDLYVVVLEDRPAASYAGGVPGFRATRPETGQRFDRSRPEVAAYHERLLDRQDEVLVDAGDPETLYRYTTAVSGFAARLTADQVRRLRGDQRVALVERSTKSRPDTVASPEFLGVPEAWSRVGGPDRAGKGTVVGVVDSGLWPESPTFNALPQRTAGASPDLPGFHGACATGEEWDARDCNEKVVSARYFVRAFGASAIAQSEYLSPRDLSGHGSRAASIAAGNDGVPVQVDGERLGRAAGMAPGARVAVYKACWAAPDPEDDGCHTADAVAAIDAAVADGVDVLNYSVAGSQEVTDAVGTAFLHATVAGVFVATSAGNDGTRGSVAHPSPWVTTVAASTHRLQQGGVRLDDGTTLVGGMAGDDRVSRTRLVLSGDAAVPGATRAEARFCETGSLDAAKVEDRIVVCDRGRTARVSKSAAVSVAGGVGMVLANPAGAAAGVEGAAADDEEADLHAVPTVHLDAAAAAVVKDYVRDREADGRPATASLEPGATDGTPVPQVAGFSSRGPTRAAGGNVLKPDVTAPGAGVLAAASPATHDGQLWNVGSGTSLSAPHVAGLAALVRGEHPEWSPARIKSSLMTTAYDVAGPSSPFLEGAGHVNGSRVLTPGLVYDVAPHRWLAAASGELSLRRLNLPSIAVGDLDERVRVDRRITNVNGRTETFRASTTGLRGVDVRVRPSVVTLAPGQSRVFRVVLRRGPDIQVGDHVYGHVTWEGPVSGTRARIPVVVRADS